MRQNLCVRRDRYFGEIVKYQSRLTHKFRHLFSDVTRPDALRWELPLAYDELWVKFRLVTYSGHLFRLVTYSHQTHQPRVERGLRRFL